MNRVKIVATLGPNVIDADTLIAMYEAGMAVARLNGSHGTIKWHEGVIELMRNVLPDVPLLLDLPGRKIRTRRLSQPLSIETGQTLLLTSDLDYEDGSSIRIGVDYSELHEAVRIGDVIRIDDGRLQMSVVALSGSDVVCVAGNGGVLQDAKGIHMPNAMLGKEFFRERDRELIDLAIKTDIDFVGLSFVETAEDVKTSREVIGNIGLISKIETGSALENLRDIIRVSDGIMIDRGDLSEQTNLENVAINQKRILHEARELACPVIVATELLHSMIHDPIPTKAEVSDITNSVLDFGTALMLSAETAVGAFPVQSIATMKAIADASSTFLQRSLSDNLEYSTDLVPEVMGGAIDFICRRLEVTKIVAITVLGYAARAVASRLPKQPILAVTNDRRSARRLNLLPGTTGYYFDIEYSRTSMEHIPICLEMLWRQGDLVDEDLILVTALGYPKSGNRMNLIETHKVADLREALGWTK